MGADFQNLPRCGAKVRSRRGATCRQVAMANGRCYLHGGKSTGPKIREGIQQMKLDNKLLSIHLSLYSNLRFASVMFHITFNPCSATAQ